MIHSTHLLKLTHGRYVNLDGVTTLVARDDAVKVWFRGEDGCETFIGEDAAIITRRLHALALIATTEIEADLASIPLPPGAERPKP